MVIALDTSFNRFMTHCRQYIRSHTYTCISFVSLSLRNIWFIQVTSQYTDKEKNFSTACKPNDNSLPHFG